MAHAPRTNPFQVFLTIVMLNNRGQQPEARRLVDSMMASDSTRMPPKLWGAFKAQRGWFTLQAGDTAAGIAAMRANLGEIGAGWNQFLTDPMNLRMATVMASRKDTREQGLQLLRHGFDANTAILPLALYALGKAEEAAGDRPAAAAAYSRFLKLWDKADPSAQPRVTEVKQALARVTGEPR
jgi:hypothetical protein